MTIPSIAVASLFGLPSPDRDHMWLKMDELLTWNPQSDVAKPYPPKGGPRRGA